MEKELNSAQIKGRIEKLQKEIEDTKYFIIHALCKETREIYEQTLIEKEEELQQLFKRNQKSTM